MSRLTSWAKRTATPEHVAQMTAEHGWYQHQLFQIESVIHGRWSYWTSALARRSISGGPWDQIPKINFTEIGSPIGPTWTGDTAWGFQIPRPAALIGGVGNRSDCQANVDYVFSRAFARGVNLREAIEWYLFAYGSSNVPEKPKGIPAEIEVLFYCGLETHRLLAHAGDWAAHIARLYYGDKGGKHCAWFPTPMAVCNLMASMTYHDEGPDMRTKTVCDPCIGTGAMLLPVSNYSLRLFGNDIDLTMVRLCEWQAWLYVPWMVWSGEGVIREFDDGLKAGVVEPDVEAAAVEVSGSTRAAAMSAAASLPVGQMLLFGADK